MTGTRLSERKDIIEKLQTAHEVIHAGGPVIKKNELLLAVFNSIFDLVTHTSDIKQVLTLAADKILEVVDVDGVLIFLLDEVSQDLTLEISRGVSASFLREFELLSEIKGYNNTVLKTGKALVIKDPMGPYLRDLNRKEPVRSEMIVPLQSLGMVMGTLCVASQTRGRFGAAERTLLNTIGNVIGVALRNTHLLREMNQALVQLRQSEEKYRDLFENAYDAIWVHDIGGNMLEANKACAKFTGYSYEELMKKNICQMMSDCSRECLDMVEDRLLKNEPVDHCCEGEVSRKGGGKAMLQITTSLITHNGKPVGFQHCARDVTDERKLEENLHYYLQQVTRAQEEERKRVARELHDEVLQKLITISRQLEKISSSEALWEESLQNVRGFKKQIEQAVREIRRFSRDLRPSILDDFGLLPALELLADDLEHQGVATSFKTVGKAIRLVPELEVMLFRIAQEASTNIRKHAKASLAEIVIEFSDGKIKLSIKDNGCGFDSALKQGDLSSSGKLGLVGMHERAKLLGGSLTLKSRLGKGTIVAVEVPSQELISKATA